MIPISDKDMSTKVSEQNTDETIDDSNTDKSKSESNSKDTSIASDNETVSFRLSLRLLFYIKYLTNDRKKAIKQKVLQLVTLREKMVVL